MTHHAVDLIGCDNARGVIGHGIPHQGREGLGIRKGDQDRVFTQTMKREDAGFLGSACGEIDGGLSVDVGELAVAGTQPCDLIGKVTCDRITGEAHVIAHILDQRHEIVGDLT